MVATRTRTTLLTASCIWCLSILAAPVGPFPAVYEFFRAICHQDPARSWQLVGHALPVCIRCASIYFGFLAALLIRLPRKAQWLRGSIVLMLAEFVLGHLLWDSATLRAITGLAVGATAAPFVTHGVEEMWGRGESV